MGIFVKRRAMGKPRTSAKKSKSKKVRMPNNLPKLQPTNETYLNIGNMISRVETHTRMGKYLNQFLGVGAKPDSTLTAIGELPAEGRCSVCTYEAPVEQFATICPRPTTEVRSQCDINEYPNTVDLWGSYNESAEWEMERERSDKTVANLTRAPPSSDYINYVAIRLIIDFIICAIICVVLDLFSNGMTQYKRVLFWDWVFN